jgi:hypothetical protein
MDLQVAANNSGAKWDTTLFNSLVKHPMLTDCTFKESIPVKVRSLESLVKEGKIPDSGGLLKIDSEGFDLDIVKGLGKSKFSVVMAEFWDADHPFGRSGHGNLNELVTELKSRGYGWHIVIYHCDQTATVSYYCNRRNTVRGSWGNAIFFNEYELFAKALRWCEDVLAPTLYR